MKKILKGYKVVHRKSNGSNWSATTGAANTLYKRKVWTRRRKGYGPYAIFNNLADAKLFFPYLLWPGDVYHVYICDYEQSKETVLHNKHYSVPSWTLPHGTVLADKVRILTIAK